MSEDLELLKKDLIYQLSFEDVDWDYFNETVERAVAADFVWQEILKSNETWKNTIEKVGDMLVEDLFQENAAKQESQFTQSEQAFEEYRKTINRIDDFFEYANESKKDRVFIQEQLDSLTKRLGKIYRTKE